AQQSGRGIVSVRGALAPWLCAPGLRMLAASDTSSTPGGMPTTIIALGDRLGRGTAGNEQILESDMPRTDDVVREVLSLLGPMVEADGGSISLDELSDD